KLVLPEDESAELMMFLGERNERVTSVLSAVEVPRAVRRRPRSPSILDRAERVIERLELVELNDSIRVLAAKLQPSSLHSLDAIHVATALDLGSDLEGLVTYDTRQGSAARTAGLDVFSPGA